MIFDLVKIVEGGRETFWHMNDDCDIRVDAFFRWGRNVFLLCNTLPARNTALDVVASPLS